VAVPREEHFVPLMIAMGSADPQDKFEVIYDKMEHGTFSYLSFKF
jgi:4,5-DOPA dioxygenase extradiol